MIIFNNLSCWGEGGPIFTLKLCLLRWRWLSTHAVVVVQNRGVVFQQGKDRCVVFEGHGDG